LLVSFLYVLAGRLLELVVLVARGDRSKEVEILVLRHELSILPAGRPAAFRAPRSFPAGGAEPGTAAPLPGPLHRQAGDAVALASAAGCLPLDVPAPPAGAAAGRAVGARADPAARAREQQLGVLSHRWRASQPRRQGVRDAGAQRARPCRRAARAAARPAELARLPPPARREHPRLRLLHRRHGLASAAVRARLHLDRQPPDRVRGLHGQPGRCVDAAARRATCFWTWTTAAGCRAFLFTTGTRSFRAPSTPSSIAKG
jgi:hypothetical protein